MPGSGYAKQVITPLERSVSNRRPGNEVRQPENSHAPQLVRVTELTVNRSGLQPPLVDHTVRSISTLLRMPLPPKRDLGNEPDARAGGRRMHRMAR